MIIGVVGGACCGKDTVADLIVQRFGFKKVSTSEIVRQELTASGKDGTRENQLIFANRRRKKYGGNYFVKEALIWASQNYPDSDLIISDIYCVAEVNHLRSIGGQIIAVDCSDIQKRFQRLKSRSSGRRDQMTFDEFESRVNAENSGSDDGPNVQKVTKLSNITILNDSTLIALTEQTYQAMSQLQKNKVDVSITIEKLPPILRDMSKQRVESSLNQDELDSKESLFRLEIEFRSIQFITKNHLLVNLEPRSQALAPLYHPTHAVYKINNQFAKTLIKAYAEPDPQIALNRFRLIDAHTTDEELVILLNDTEFLKMHSQLKQHLLEIDSQIIQSISEAQNQISINDKEQFRGAENRSFAKCIKDGFSVRLQPDGVEKLRKAQSVARDSPIPLLELIKNEKIIESAGLPNSKISLAVHDLMDHIWLCGVLTKNGIFDLHRGLFDSIGNPELTNIFKREGETFASIAFGIRHWATTDVGFSPLVPVSQIVRHFDSLFDDNKLDSSGLESYRLLRKIASNPQSRTAQCLSFTFSNYLVELDEQRRKHGTIKQREPKSHDIVGELDPWGVEFLSFFVDTTNLLLQSRTKHRDSLLRIHILLEEFFLSPAALQCQPLSIYVDQLEKIDFTKTSLPPPRIIWMASNYGFTALRDSVL